MSQNGIVIENTLNKGDNLPFGYYDPLCEGKLTWTCNYGITGKEIVSVFCMKDDKIEKDVKYLNDLEEAKFCRAELIKNGWLPLKTPNINITVNGK